MEFVFILILATVELAFWMAIIGFLAVAVLMAVKSVINEDIDKGIHDDENNARL